jgi:hypothetical protein
MWILRTGAGTESRRSATSSDFARPVDRMEKPKTPPLIEKLAYTIQEAALLSSLGQTSIYKAIGDLQLKSRKYGTRTIIRHADLEFFLDNLPAETKLPEG